MEVTVVDYIHDFGKPTKQNNVLSYITPLLSEIEAVRNSLDAARDHFNLLSQSICTSHRKIYFSNTEIKLNKLNNEKSWKSIFVAQVDAETKIVPGLQKYQGGKRARLLQ